MEQEDLRSAETKFEEYLEVEEQIIDVVLFRLSQLLDKVCIAYLLNFLYHHFPQCPTILLPLDRIALCVSHQPLCTRTPFLQRTVLGTCVIVEYCSLCIVDLKTEAHVNCIEVDVACLNFLTSGARGGSSWLQNIPLPTQYPNPNPHLHKPKPHQMQLLQT